MMALARKIVSGDEEDEAETIEDVLVQARNAEATAEELLVDDGWKLVEVELETVAVNGNGNGHHDAGGIGPTVELVLSNGHAASGNGNGHAPVPINGNGHYDEAEEPQQSLFSWAEFMAEEPVKPKRRGSKPRPASLSMFEWALELEQGREKGDGQRRALDRNIQGEDTEIRRSSPCQSMYAALFCVQAHRLPMCVGLLSCPAGRNQAPAVAEEFPFNPTTYHIPHVRLTSSYSN